MMLNILSSRYKSERYQQFLENKFRVTSYLTMFVIFQPTQMLQKVARKVIESIKKVVQENSYFGFMVLMFSLKMILNDIYKSLRNGEDQFMYIDKFVKSFYDIWLTKR